MSTDKLSIYQQEIIDAVLHKQGNLLIKAFAGCGKTYTLIKIMEVLDSKATKFYCAFNKDIVEEIKDKSKNIENLDISTIHSLGYKIIQRNNEQLIQVDEDKYNTFINNHTQEISETYALLTYNEKSKFRANLKKLVNYSRNNLCDGKKCIEDIANKFGINLLGDEVNTVRSILQWGKSNIETIDYGDMIWLPNVLPYRFPHYDFMFVDENQDLSVAQQQIVLKCKNIKTRFIFAGDEFQSIYAFSGADANSYHNFTKVPNTTIYSLPICYRCSDLIVELASQIVPEIKENSNNKQGYINYQSTIQNIHNGDMVLCRKNAPLIKLYMDFISQNKPCYIRGKELENELVEAVNLTNQEFLNINLKEDGVFVRLWDEAFRMRDNIMKYEECEDKIAIMSASFKHYMDIISTLEILSDGLTTSKELITRIETVFNCDKKDGISLSTIHKAKGLESDNVHILGWSLFKENLKQSRNEQEKQQEENLKYVAITRAKQSLSFIEDETYSKYMSIIKLDDLEKIEFQVNTILGKTKEKLTINYAKKIIEQFTPIQKENKNNVVVGLSKTNSTTSTNRTLNKLNKLKFTK